MTTEKRQFWKQKRKLFSENFGITPKSKHKSKYGYQLLAAIMTAAEEYSKLDQNKE